MTRNAVFYDTAVGFDAGPPVTLPRWTGAWSGATAYVIGDAVSLAGSAYVCILGHTNHTPPNVTYWGLFVSKGDTGSTGSTGATGSAGPNTVTAATSTNLTGGLKGDGANVSGGSTTADIPDSSNKRYVTDANLTTIGNQSGTNTGDQTTVSGNAGTATALQTGRTIDGQTFDGTANITVIAAGTHAATSKATPVDADELPLVDSAASNVLKKLTWANLKATVKAYTDTLYPAGSGTSSGTNTGDVAFATNAVLLGSAAAAGAAGTVMRSDGMIAAFDATVPTTQAFSDAAAVGTAAFAARRDHKHAMPATPLNYGVQRPLVDPTTYSWSWVNQGSCTITSNGASLGLFTPQETADNWHFRVKAFPHAAPYTVIIHLNPCLMPIAFSGVMVGWQLASTGAFVGFSQYQNGSSSAMSPNSVKGAISAGNYIVTANYITRNFAGDYFRWVKIEDDNTNRIISLSPDGYTWVAFHSIGRTDYITPDRLVFGIESRNATYGAALQIDSWEEA